MCGENDHVAQIAPAVAGSSPRVRGKPIVAPVEHDPPGLIPACAGKTGGRRETLRGEPAHPRVCGENEGPLGLAGGPAGSSPRVRGKRRSSHPTGPREGLIPACAGKTSRGPPRPQGPGAHPRVCGENLKIAPTPLLPPGSSPRVRGKPLRQARIQPDGRLIPACAGKTPSPPSSRTRARAHPRVCGENRGFVLSVGFWNGSSPRVRGKPLVELGLLHVHRLIPACAGKTTRRTRSAPCPPAHPRVCGENSPSSPSAASLAGSSPRVRGKQNPPGPDASDLGLIPACAGKTSSPPSCSSRRVAHPRVCGENTAWAACCGTTPGSSPRVRGKRELGARHGHRDRLIPACAGKTAPAKSPARSRRAHPHVCGENAAQKLGPGVLKGSSPRVRGKQRRRQPPRGRRGLIPACAGKTDHFNPFWHRLPAHPRVCGENREVDALDLLGEGSSPRVRGKRATRTSKR